jgi:hypothetical protein
MRPDVVHAFDRMAAAARRDGIYLIVVSGYRSDAEQAKLFAAQPAPQLSRVLGALTSTRRIPLPRRSRLALGARSRAGAHGAGGCGPAARARRRRGGRRRAARLTPRERRCLALVAAGAPNRGVRAPALHGGEDRGRARVADLAKLDVRSRTEAGARRPPARARRG